MTPLVGLPFAETFTFTRSCAATVRDANGAPVVVGVNAPRFDYLAPGLRGGLLVEGPPLIAAADRLRVIEGDWAVPPSTILHVWRPPGGEVTYRAWYAGSNQAASIVNACLAQRGHHREITSVPLHLPNEGGFVRWRDQSWSLGGLILAEAGVALGQTPDRILLEG
ncbi:hypothetical protein [Brevundimonas sp.]|uniref:hypothetical protein n=1 Tax=Brevundimonas sp. TaxID=1871086 RepID=UPI003D6C8A8E